MQLTHELVIKHSANTNAHNKKKIEDQEKES